MSKSANHSKCIGHTVKSGECLSKIVEQYAKPYGLNIHNLNQVPHIQGNEAIKDINLIYPGQFIHFKAHQNVETNISGDLHLHLHLHHHDHYYD